MFVSEDEIPRKDLDVIVDKATQRFLNGESKGTFRLRQSVHCA